MIKASVGQHIGVVIKKSNQSALQATVNETSIMLSRDNSESSLDALVVNDLDIDILADIPFMSTNDICVRPAKQHIVINITNIDHYGTSSDTHNCVRPGL